MANTRLDLRLDEAIKARAEKASALLGSKSLTEYIIKLIDENSKKIISEYEGIILKDDIFDRFIKACNDLEEPNSSLIEAGIFTRNQGIK